MAALVGCGEDSNTGDTQGVGGGTGGSPDGGGGMTSAMGGGGQGPGPGGAGPGGAGGVGGGGEGGSMAMAPNAPTNLQGTPVSSSDASLVWLDNSDDETGFRIERSVAGADMWSEVETVSADVTNYTDMTNDGGSIDYRVFAVNDEGDSDPSNIAPVHLEVPYQSATLEIDLDASTVTVVNQPTHVTLAPNGNVTWAGVGNPLTFDLDAQNTGFNRPIFNLKARVASVSDGTASGDDTYDGDPILHYGIQGIDIAATRTKTFTLDNVTQTTGVITATVEMMNHPIIMGSDGYHADNLTLHDIASNATMQLDVGILGNPGMGSPESSPDVGGGESGALNGIMSPDGRFAYYGHRNQPAMMIVDFVSMTVSNGDDLTGNNNIQVDGQGLGSFGHVRGVVMSPDGKYLYATVNQGSSTYECSTSYTADDMTLEIVRVERETLAVVDRVTLLTGVREAQARRVSLSADGTVGAVAIRTYSSSYGTPAATVQGKMFLIDMETMTIIDGDPTPGDQMAPFDLSAIGTRVDKAVIAPDGEKVYLAISDAPDAALRVLDLATGTVDVLPTPSFDQDRTRDLKFGIDGRLYWATKVGFAIYDPSSGSLFEPALVLNATWSGDNVAITFGPDRQSLYLSYNSSNTLWFDMGSDALLLFPGSGLTEKATTQASEGHGFLMTRY